MKKINHPIRTVFTGKSQMGKTTLMVDLIRRRLIASVQRCYVVCPTWYEQPAFQPLRRIKGAFPAKRVYTEATEEVFEEIYRKIKKENARVGRKIPTLLLVDDCAAERALHTGNHGAFGRLAISAPHLNLSIACTVQKLVSASPLLRENTEVVICFYPSRKKDVNILIDEYNPCPWEAGSSKTLRRMMGQCWDKKSYCTIFREPLTGHTAYHIGLGQEVQLPRDEDGY